MVLKMVVMTVASTVQKLVGKLAALWVGRKESLKVDLRVASMDLKTVVPMVA